MSPARRYIFATVSQAWITSFPKTRSHVPLQMISGVRPRRKDRNLNMPATPSRPFQISIVSRDGIRRAQAAAAMSMSSTVVGYVSGASSLDVSASVVSLGHAQAGSRAALRNTSLASTMKAADRCLSLRLALVTDRPTSGLAVRTGSQ